ncbi:MAG TPA: Na/Pi cotransporter family protein [Aestuariivirgaceae bacterium]|nr:Na/Pi cotransporter family protein [Aestuariivirgaceae bacterium]
MRPGAEILINLVAAVAMLLWGVRMVRTGVTRAWGDWLKGFLRTKLSRRHRAVAAGLGATLILQSGTATALILASLASTGLITPSAGLAALLGADLGSATVSAIFSVAGPHAQLLSPIFIIAGYSVFVWSSTFRMRNAGRVMLGLGLMFLALKLVVGATDPIRNSELFRELIAAAGGEPLIALIVGAAAVWLSQSTLPVILLVTSFLHAGTLDLAAALSLILGLNVGGGLPAVLATAGQPLAARRLPLANFLCRTGTALLLLPLSDHLAAAMMSWGGSAVVKAALFHVGFNLLLALVFLPLVEPVADLMRKVLPEQPVPEDGPGPPRYLDPLSLEMPAIALSNAQAEIARMTEILDRMFELVAEVLRTGKLEPLKLIKRHEERLTAYQSAIHVYLADLSHLELEPDDSRRAMEIALFVSNLEHAGDVIDLNLRDRLKAKIKESIEFSQEQQAALDKLVEIVRDNLRLAASVLASGDISGARHLINQKAAFRTIENRVIGAHLRPGSGGWSAAPRASALFVDLVRDLHRINSHVISAAYPIADKAGVLLGTRLKAESAGTGADPAE